LEEPLKPVKVKRAEHSTLVVGLGSRNTRRIQYGEEKSKVCEGWQDSWHGFPRLQGQEGKSFPGMQKSLLQKAQEVGLANHARPYAFTA